MTKQITVLLLFVFISAFSGYAYANYKNPDFQSLNERKMYQRIITERDIAIQKAVEKGEYKCCINPPCTMCYMEANQWNNFKAGTCACDDLIAEGKDPCPQCARGICETKEKGACNIHE